MQGRALDLSLVPSSPSSPAEGVKPGKGSGPGQCHPDTGGCHRNWGLAVPLAGHGTHVWGTRGGRRAVALAAGAGTRCCPHPRVSRGAGLRPDNSSHLPGLGFKVLLRSGPLSPRSSSPQVGWDPRAWVGPRGVGGTSGWGLTPPAPTSPSPGLAPAIPTVWSRWTTRLWPGMGDTLPPRGGDTWGGSGAVPGGCSHLCYHRTATVWKSLNPFWGEEYTLRLPHGFRSLAVYVLDEDTIG